MDARVDSEKLEHGDRIGWYRLGVLVLAGLDTCMAESGLGLRVIDVRNLLLLLQTTNPQDARVYLRHLGHS